MAIQEAIIDHLALPCGTLLAIHRDLIAMPRFDRCEKAVLAGMPNCDIARSALRPRRRIALGNLGLTPLAILAKLVHLDARESGRQDFIPAIAVPIQNREAVH